MTSIEWCQNPDGSKGKSWNPIRARNVKTGRVGHYCEHVTDACRFCYAERLNLNTRNLPYGGTGLPFKPGHLGDVEIYLDEEKLLEPLSWRKPQRVFVDSMDDPFGHWVKGEWLDKMFAVMALRPEHTFILLTKRPERAKQYLSQSVTPYRRVHAGGEIALFDDAGAWGYDLNGVSSQSAHCLRFEVAWPLPNVWLLVSCGDQADVDRFVPIVLRTPAALRGVSLEPLLGPIDLTNVGSSTASSAQLGINALTGHSVRPAAVRDFGRCWPLIRWVIAGGESGTRDQAVRPMHPDWPRSLRDQCKAANVPFFFKQWGEYQPIWERRADADDRRVPAVHGVAGRRFLNLAGGHGFHGEAVVAVERVGKARTGHLLDGVAHQEWPEVAR